MPEVLTAPVYKDPFHPVLKNSPSLNLTGEQDLYIRDILKICCADSRFAEKAYLAIGLVLTAGTIEVPTVGSLVPSTVVLGEPSFDIHVIGTGFTPYSKIVFNGFDEPTTYISDTELTTGVNMPLWQAPVVVPVSVRTGEQYSEPVDFEFTAPVVRSVPTTVFKDHVVKEHKEPEVGIKTKDEFKPVHKTDKK